MLFDLRGLKNPASRNAFAVLEMLAFRSTLGIKYTFQLAHSQMHATCYDEDEDPGERALSSTCFDHNFEKKNSK